MSEFYLSDVSEKDKPWDNHRALADQIRDLYQQTEFATYAERIDLCSKLLQFALIAPTPEERAFKLELARFCRVRHCPVCQWRRSLMWKGRFINALPRISQDYPTGRWIFLTLTVRNCAIAELRDTVSLMNQAFKRLSLLKAFPALGWIKSLEVTRGKDGTAHPHFHVLVLVPGSYFKSRKYINHEQWQALWRRCLRISYDPILDIRAVKPRKGKDATSAVVDALKETLKYTVKESDLSSDRNWLLQLTEQLHKTRAIGIGGVLRNYLSEAEPENEDLIHADDEPIGEILPDDQRWLFGWREKTQRYVGNPKD